MAQKSATCPGCRFGGEAILLQCAESIIIQIKIPLLILYLLSYVRGIQKMYWEVIDSVIKEIRYQILTEGRTIGTKFAKASSPGSTRP